MTSIKDLEREIQWFQNEYNVIFEPSEIYALFPKGGEYGWNRNIPYPNCTRAGVYAFLDEDMSVVYIGKARNFGKRFGQYFGYAEDGESCMIRDARVPDARYIKNYATPNGKEYMALSLEEYLISKLNPKDNTMSRTEW